MSLWWYVDQNNILALPEHLYTLLSILCISRVDLFYFFFKQENIRIFPISGWKGNILVSCLSYFYLISQER